MAKRRGNFSPVLFSPIPLLSLGARGAGPGKGAPGGHQRHQPLQSDPTLHGAPPCTGLEDSSFFMAIFYTAILKCSFLTNCTDSRELT